MTTGKHFPGHGDTEVDSHIELPYINADRSRLDAVDQGRQGFGGPVRLLVAKPGLDGHSNGAEQIAVAARDAGMEVIYQGIRLTPEEIAAVAVEEDPEVIGLSILSGSHLELIPEVVAALRTAGVTAPIIAGGILPEEDRPALLEAGLAAVYTPKDFELGRIMSEIADLAVAAR
jgi:ethylmalonyl-CoA mutase